MNSDKFIEYLERPEELDLDNLREINDVLQEYPYFQTAHMLLVKTLNNLRDLRFNSQLKVSAIHIGNRHILFNLLHEQHIASGLSPAKDMPDEAVEQYTESAGAEPEADKPEVGFTEALETGHEPENGSAHHETDNSETEAGQGDPKAVNELSGAGQKDSTNDVADAAPEEKAEIISLKQESDAGENDTSTDISSESQTGRIGDDEISVYEPPSGNNTDSIKEEVAVSGGTEGHPEESLADRVMRELAMLRTGRDEVQGPETSGDADEAPGAEELSGTDKASVTGEDPAAGEVPFKEEDFVEDDTPGAEELSVAPDEASENAGQKRSTVLLLDDNEEISVTGGTGSGSYQEDVQSEIPGASDSELLELDKSDTLTGNEQPVAYQDELQDVNEGFDHEDPHNLRGGRSSSFPLPENETAAEKKNLSDTDNQKNQEIKESGAHSFYQWLDMLQTSSVAGFKENEGLPEQDNHTDDEHTPDLIDKFLKDKPRIEPRSPLDDIDIHVDISALSPGIKESEDFFTETLAKIYIQQKHYKKAVYAYEKLCLKFPEKYSYFADQIDEIKRLINH